MQKQRTADVRKLSMYSMRYKYPHDVFVNGREGTRIAHKRWKRARAKYMRTCGDKEAQEGFEERELDSRASTVSKTVGTR